MVRWGSAVARPGRSGEWLQEYRLQYHVILVLRNTDRHRSEERGDEYSQVQYSPLSDVTFIFSFSLSYTFYLSRHIYNIYIVVFM
jgi:hypothetical protein